MQKWLAVDGDIVALVKPQFEAGPELVGKGGIVRDTAVHRAVLQELLTWTNRNGLAACRLMRSPVTGSDGNVEFLLWLRAGEESGIGEDVVRGVVEPLS
ncbi:MAG: hypothetical protein HC804_10050 [Anaerolineae bacterium]|nr:hypothetical protein [Anaerolineae bacterium]